MASAMEEMFDLLARNGLRDETTAERAIMGGWPAKKVADFYMELGRLMEETAQEQTAGTNFTFLASGDLSGYERGSCAQWDCRQRRVDFLGRFAVLWADKVFIRSYQDLDFGEAMVADEVGMARLRYSLVGDLKCMLSLRPLVLEGVVELVVPNFHFCEECGRRVRSAIGDYEGVTEAYTKEMLTLHSDDVTMEAVLNPSDLDHGRCTVAVKGPEDIYAHGGALLEYDRPPKWLLDKCRGATSSGRKGRVALTKSEMLRLGALRDSLENAASEAVYHRIFSTRTNATYMTGNAIEAAFLGHLGNDAQMKQYNSVLHSALEHELPVLQGMPVEELLKVRRSEREAFLVYRNSIRQAVDEYVLKGKPLTEKDAKEMVSDVIRPRLDAVNKSIHVIRSRAKKELAKDMVIATSVVLGLVSNVLPLQIMAAIGGGVTVKDLVKQASGLVETADEIRNDNMYFLWRVLKSGTRKR